MYLIPTLTRRQASPTLRDRFLTALAQRDEATVRQTARDLHGCVNLLPSAVCIQFDLPPGSSYGDAAEAINKQMAAGGPAVA